MTQISRVDDFTAFVAARRPILIRSAVLMGCRVADAEDLVQSALAKCFVAWKRVQAAGNRDAYVYRVLLNEHRSALRKRSASELPVASMPDRSPVWGSNAVENADLVDRLLGGLRTEEREVLVLRFYADLTEREVGDLLGLPLGTVKSRSSRALTQLAAAHSHVDTREGR